MAFPPCRSVERPDKANDGSYNRRHITANQLRRSVELDNHG